MKIVEEKQKAVKKMFAQHGIPVNVSSTTENLDKVRKAAELQAKIQAQLKANPALLSGTIKQDEGKSKSVLVDAEGRTVDMSGKAVQLPLRRPTVMVNIRAQKKDQMEKVARRGPQDVIDESSPFYDPRLDSVPSGRQPKAFKFNEPGKFIKMGQTLRAKVQLEKLQNEIAATAKKTGISAATRLALITPSFDNEDDVIPEVEWWDALILSIGRYPPGDEELSKDSFKNLSNLVEHPIPVYPPGEPNKTKELPIYLTKDERKKLRKQHRRELEQEKQEKIQLGLMERPETKVRMSNLMRVLKTEAVQDPTKIEAHVKAQMAARQKKHESDNLSRKLTKEQRRVKTIRKLAEDTTHGVHVNLFRIKDLSNPANKFKVDTNAQQLHLTGCLIVNKELNLVIVEGGPKCLKKYRNLLMKRIKWNVDKRGRIAEEDGEVSSVSSTSCQLVWEGIRETRSFYNWSIKQFKTEQQAKDHLKKVGAEFYWDLALSGAIIEKDEED
jgi:U4/U6 small nuclear ribonucleoprotein PRP3